MRAKGHYAQDALQQLADARESLVVRDDQEHVIETLDMYVAAQTEAASYVMWTDAAAMVSRMLTVSAAGCLQAYGP